MPASASPEFAVRQTRLHCRQIDFGALDARLAGVGGGLDLFSMEAGGRADQYGIDILRRHDLVDAGDLGAIFLSQCLGCGGHGVGEFQFYRADA